MPFKQVDSVQQAADYSVRQLVKQGVRCVDEDTERCMYADGQGNHCAIGWLMDHDDPELMSYDESINTLDPQLLPDIVINNIHVFVLLQHFHDDVSADKRQEIAKRLQSHGVDTSAEHWQKWIALGI